MTEMVMSVPDISCGHCKSSIEGALRPLPGIASADVDVAAKTVRVAFDAPATLADITAAIEEQGYAVAAAD